MLAIAHHPLDWTGLAPVDEEQQQEVFSKFMQSLTQEARVLAHRRVWDDRMPEWRAAYGLTGTGSASVRARFIAEQVYERAAPVPDETPSRDRNEFLHQVVSAVERAAKASDVVLR